MWPLGIKFAFIVGAGASLNAAEVPQRIVSLAPSVTEGIFFLGAGDRIVGDTIYCDRPPEAKKKTKIGTLLEPNIEKVMSLNPDLVLATENGNDPQVLKKLTGVGLTVAVIPASSNFSDLCKNFILLGGLVGENRRADILVREAREKIGEIMKRIEGLPRKTVFWEIGARPLITAGRGGYLDEMTRISGGENIAGAHKGSWIWYSREEVVSRDPDTIILTRMGDAGEDEIKAWKGYETMKAVKGRRFLVMEPEDINPLPMYFVSGVEKLAHYLHPEAFVR